MSSKVIISTDSTADLSPEIEQRFDIRDFHLPIVIGEETKRDGLTIHTTDIFDYKERTGNLTKTSAANVAEYEEYFRKLSENGEHIIHFTISSDMSSAYRNACLAADEVGSVFVIDSRNLSTGIGLLVLKACDLRDSGMEAVAIANKIRSITDNVRASFVLDTLEYMKKGGRCSSVVALGANLLKLKPCIEVIDGKMEVAKKYRGKINEVYKQYILDHLPEKSKLDTTRVFITHTCVYDDSAKQMAKMVEDMGIFDEVFETTAGCSVSVHCGPGTLGILFIEK